MAAALKLAKVRPEAGAKGSVIIKAEAQKQRALPREEGSAADRDPSDGEGPALTSRRAGAAISAGSCWLSHPGAAGGVRDGSHRRGRE
jgi:hypothetical protein